MASDGGDTSGDHDDDPDASGDGSGKQRTSTTTDAGVDTTAEARRREEAKARDGNRRQARETLNPSQPRDGNLQYDLMPTGPQVSYEILPADADQAAQLASDGIGAASSSSAAAQSSMAGEGDYVALPDSIFKDHVESNADADKAGDADAKQDENRQDQKAADAARKRKRVILGSVLGGALLTLTTAAVLGVIFGGQKDDGTAPRPTNIDGGDGHDPGAPVTVDVASQARTADTNADPVDPASIRLTGAPDDNPGTLTQPGLGTWRADAAGKVTFTPDPAFEGGEVTAGYTIADTAGDRSVPAAIRIGFAMTVVSGTGGPVVQDVAQSLNVTQTGTADVAASAQPGPSGAMVDPSSVEFVGADPAEPKTLFVLGAGTWAAASGGTITFTPIEGFLGGVVQVRYTVADMDGNRSDSGAIVFTYQKRPVAANVAVQVDRFDPATPVSVNLIDGSAGMPPRVDPARTLAPQNLLLLAPAKDPGDATGPNAISANGGKTIEVDDEGVWDAQGTPGIVTFTPAPMLSGDPHPILYQIGDDLGILSNPAALVLGSSVTAIEESFDGLNDADDDTFWATYRRVLIDGDLGDESLTALLIVGAVTTTLRANTLRGIRGSGRGAVVAAQQRFPVDELVQGYKDWISRDGNPPDDPLSRERLLRLSEAYDDAQTGLGAVPLGTRLIRLLFIDRLVARFENEMTQEDDG